MGKQNVMKVYLSFSLWCFTNLAKNQRGYAESKIGTSNRMKMLNESQDRVKTKGERVIVAFTSVDYIEVIF